MMRARRSARLGGTYASAPGVWRDRWAGIPRVITVWWGGVVLALLAASGGLHAQVYDRSGPDPFPHGKHATLFPTCAGCHAGMMTGDAAAVMPPPALCAECHDGTIKPSVTYVRPTPRQDFLRFSHTVHASKVEVSARDCSTCHAPATDAPWMNVRRAPPELCQTCHTHRSTGHLAPDSRCANCHIVVARSQTLTGEHILSLPKPPSHARERFSEQHEVSTPQEAAQCATCHTRETCARCHVNAADVPAIRELLPDARVAALLRGRTVRYATPTDHLADAWSTAHGRSAEASTRRCAACHARPSCTVCHSGTLGGDVIRRLPDGLAGTPGVQLILPRGGQQPDGALIRQAVQTLPALPHVDRPRAAPDTLHTVVRPHPPEFARQHAASASSGAMTCEGCHTQRFCSDCHAGESKRSFHAANFVARHAPESYGRDLECSGCHNTEVFCRSCHLAQGIATSGRSSASFHNAQPLWLLQHGQAARRGLQSCTTCHAQRDCMRCHAQTGWGVNPHGPDFDASRLGAKAKAMCARCHIADPLRGR